MLRRPLPALVSLVCLAAAAATAVACSDIGLSTSGTPSGTFASTNGGPGGSESDAGQVGLGAAAPTAADSGDAGASDAAAATTVGNPLCFYSYAADAGNQRVCEPDTSNGCASPDPDAGIYDPWDAGDAEPSTACHVSANAQACSPSGSGGDGAQCQTSADCTNSFECVGSPGVCRHYCCGGNAACDSASDQTTAETFCDVQPTASGGLNVPVCEPISNCALLSPCPVKGDTCAIVKDDGTTSCISIGPQIVGQSCDVYHCAAGLTCLGTAGSRSCFALCEVDSTTACPTGKTCTSSAQLFTNANIGICQ
jgi:hypothetical protein